MVRYRAQPADVKRAGFGPITDGVPEPVGDRGESERRMPPPLGVEMCTAEITKRYRKVKS